MTDINTTIDNATSEILQKIDDAWPSPIVLRKDIAKFSCGLATRRSVETADQRGYGIPNKMIINGKTAYTKEAVLKWLENRTKPDPTEEKKNGDYRSHKNDILLNKI
jgi:hypothetical protein